MSREPRLAIASTMRAPGPRLRSWIAYHRAIGFEQLFLYFDDPADPDLAIAAAAPGVTAIACDDRFVRGLRSHSLWPYFGKHVAERSGHDRVMARQVLHVQDAVARIEAAPRRRVDWLLHIDDDELFYVADRDAPGAFAQLADDGVEQAVFLNLEAVPESLDITDAFREVTLFKHNPATIARTHGARASRTAARRFMAYMRGKAAIRVDSAGVPNGVHGFERSARPLATVVLEQPAILHYANCGFAQWRAKYATLGDFADRWFGGAPVKLPFHLRSRDLRELDDAAARSFYRRSAMLGGPADREQLVRRGYAARIRVAQRVLAAIAR